MKKLLLLILLLSGKILLSQVLYNPNDERFKSLYLEKTQNDYKLQKDDFSRQKALYEKGLIPVKEFKEAESRFKTAQLIYQPGYTITC